MNPNHKEKYNEGYDSYWGGKQKDDCPYPIGSSDYVSWVDGWFQAITEAGYTESDYPQS